MQRLPGLKGRLTYRRRASGAEWGFEEWTMRRGADGLLVLSAHCELEQDGQHVARDIVQSVDAHYHPQDALVRLMVDRRYHGSAWYKFDDTSACCESTSADDGRSSQHFPIDRTIRGFLTHSLQSEAWLLARFDFRQGGAQFWRRNLMTSTHHLGATGPRFMTTDSGLELLGTETVRTPAGTFDCWALRFVGTSNKHPPYVAWVSRDDRFLYVRGHADGYMDAEFELAELASLNTGTPEIP